MKKLSIYTFIICIVAGMAMINTSCHKEHNHSAEEAEHEHVHGEECDHEHDHDHEGEHEHEHEHEHDGEHGEEGAHGEESADEITLSPEKAERFGVVAQEIQPGTFSETIKVSGQMLGAQGDVSTVTATSTGIIKLSSNAIAGKQVNAGALIATISGKNIAGGDANQQAKVALDAAKRELDRLTPLYKDKLVTASVYNEAVREYERAKLACTSPNGGGSAVAAISGTVVEVKVTDGQFVEAGEQIATVSKNARLVLRADIPTRYANLSKSVTDANFKPSNSAKTYSISSLGGKKTSAGVYSSTSPGYIPAYFEFNNNGEFISGSFAEVYLLGNQRQNVIYVPIDALTEELGNFFVYIKLDEECYQKRRVELGARDGINAEITSGIEPGETVVIKGAMIVKMASHTGAIPHSHSH